MSAERVKNFTIMLIASLTPFLVAIFLIQTFGTDETCNEACERQTQVASRITEEATPQAESTEPIMVTEISTEEATQSPTFEPCIWNWNNQALPELTEQVQTALDEADLADVTVNARAFGEDCLGSTGNVQYFATMETDYQFTIPVENFDDLNAMGEKLQAVIKILEQFPVSDTPGPNPGRIFVTFTAGDEQKSLNFQRVDAEGALTQSGEDFLKTLGYIE